MTYALDTTGTLAANKITQEVHTVNAVNGQDFQVIIPKFAPFYSDTMRVWYRNGSTLTTCHLGSDWNPSLHFQSASLSTAKPVHCGVSLTGLGYTGELIMEYQTVGGEWVLDAQRIDQILAELIYNPRGMTWEAITGMRENFPPVNHKWEFDDMVGMKEVTQGLDNVAQAVLNKASSSYVAPPISKTSMGLGNVQDYAPANIAVGIAGDSNNHVLTPLVLKAILDHYGLLNLSAATKQFTDHLTDFNNPHKTRKGHVDLPSIENLPMTTPTDILANRRVRKYVTLADVIDYNALHGCRPGENAEPDYATRGSIVSYYCENLAKFVIKNDGGGGTYTEVYEVESRDCGYVLPSFTQYPARGEVLYKQCVGFDQYAYVADGYGNTFQKPVRFNSPDCGYSDVGSPGSQPASGTILAVNCRGTTLVREIANGVGGSTIVETEHAVECASPIPSYPLAHTLVDAFCEGVVRKGVYTNGVGGHYNAIINLYAPECGYVDPNGGTPPSPGPNVPDPGPTPGGPSPTVPPAANSLVASLASSVNTLAVGYTTVLTVDMAGLTAAVDHSLEFHWRRGDSGTWRALGQIVTFKPTQATASLTLEVGNNGDVQFDNYQFRAVVAQATNSKESNAVTVAFQGTRSIALKINQRTGTLNTKNGEMMKVDIDFQGWPVTAKSPKNAAITYQLVMKGAEDRALSEWTMTTKPYGDQQIDFVDGLVLNGDITGRVNYTIIASYTDELTGQNLQVSSNTVAVDWYKY